MKLSTKGRYGLRAMIDLGRHSQEEAVSINSIAKRQNISESYLEQIIALLKKAGLVLSLRGAAGGYQLAKEAKNITVGDILRALEGDLNPVDCPGVVKGGACADAHSCVAKYVWKKIGDSINETVDQITLAELIEENRQIIEQ